jgi:hypothetical protein
VQDPQADDRGVEVNVISTLASSSRSVSYRQLLSLRSGGKQDSEAIFIGADQFRATPLRRACQPLRDRLRSLTSRLLDVGTAPRGRAQAEALRPSPPGVPGLFVIVGSLINPTGLPNLLGENGAGVAIGQGIQQIGVITALIAGGAATRVNYRAQARP